MSYADVFCRRYNLVGNHVTSDLHSFYVIFCPSQLNAVTLAYVHYISGRSRENICKSGFFSFFFLFAIETWQAIDSM